MLFLKVVHMLEVVGKFSLPHLEKASQVPLFQPALSIFSSFRRRQQLLPFPFLVYDTFLVQFSNKLCCAQIFGFQIPCSDNKETV